MIRCITTTFDKKLVTLLLESFTVVCDFIAYISDQSEKYSTMASSFTPSPTIHSMKRRARWHDYSAKGLYMITLTVNGRKPLLGKLCGTPHPHVELSSLGKRIFGEELKRIPYHYPNVEVWKSILMPDHIHFILYVKETFAEGIHLGTVLKGFKVGCNRAIKELEPSSSPTLFEKGYNDKILLDRDRLCRWCHYLDDNPRRLWLKRSNPNLFTVIRHNKLAGRECEMIGNIFLLDYPEMEAVVVHRAYSEGQLGELRQKWMLCGLNGGVLVRAAISPKEKEVMHEAMDRGYNVIYLRDNGFPDLYKPAGRAFDACCAGRLLQISPFDFRMQKEAITREKCLTLNALAEDIAAGLR